MSRYSDYEQLTFNDLAPGDRFALGEYALTREEVIEFASKYDPQPFHLDDEAARRNPLFKGISASGWHSMLILQRMIGEFWEHTRVRGLGGAGVTDLRWHKPVYPGDRLIGEMAIASIRRSRSKPDRGIISIDATFRDAAGEPVTSFTITGVFAAD